MITQKEIIETVLRSTKSKKRKTIETKWFEFLEEKLEFPFEAEVNLISYSEVFNDGEIVKVLEIYDTADMYGVLMKTKKNRKIYYLPLEELILLDKESINYKIIDAFLEWSANY